MVELALRSGSKVRVDCSLDHGAYPAEWDFGERLKWVREPLSTGVADF